MFEGETRPLWSTSLEALQKGLREILEMLISFLGRVFGGFKSLLNTLRCRNSVVANCCCMCKKNRESVDHLL